MFIPLVSDTTSTPSASAPLEMRAMAASPRMRPLCEMRSSSTAASATTGTVTASGAQAQRRGHGQRAEAHVREPVADHRDSA